MNKKLTQSVNILLFNREEDQIILFYAFNRKINYEGTWNSLNGIIEPIENLEMATRRIVSKWTDLYVNDWEKKATICYDKANHHIHLIKANSIFGKSFDKDIYDSFSILRNFKTKSFSIHDATVDNIKLKYMLAQNEDDKIKNITINYE